MVTLTGSSPGGRCVGVAVGRGSTTDGPGKGNMISGHAQRITKPKNSRWQ